ncbi:MAG: S41 family peptidase [Marinifilaceae bacterium]|nr:S41 family peptidase [Marinifilaceae bacterium]
MIKFARFILLSVIAVFGATSISYAQQTDEQRHFKVTKALNTHNMLLREVNRLYVDTVDVEKMVEAGINAMLATLDPYTVFYPETNIDEVKLMTKGEYGGIGAVIGMNKDKEIIIREPYRGTPSYKAKLLPGDVMMSINGIDMAGKATIDATNILRGPAGEELEIKIKRGDEKPFIVKLVREKIQLPNIPYYGIIRDTIGYIYLSSFTETAAKDVRNALLDLKSQGAKAIVLDLRNNGGGLMDQAIEIVSMFVPKGSPVVSVKGRIPQINKEMKTTQNPIMPDMPLAILINSGTASASEIVSGALQDMDRAVLIGTRSLGKGLVQNVRPLPYNTQLKVTTAKYYIPSGRCVQAIDYSHKDENGNATALPDSLRKEFRTNGGRIVYDGAGIDPDIVIKDSAFQLLTQELVLNDYIFDFVNEYANNNTAPEDVNEYVIPTSIYDEFTKYVLKQDFDYITRGSNLIDGVSKAFENENYPEEVTNLIQKLKEAVKPNLEGDMAKYKDEIMEALIGQLITRYYDNEGYIEFTVKNQDKYIDKAIEGLNSDILKVQ